MDTNSNISSSKVLRVLPENNVNVFKPNVWEIRAENPHDGEYIGHNMNSEFLFHLLPFIKVYHGIPQINPNSNQHRNI